MLRPAALRKRRRGDDKALELFSLKSRTAVVLGGAGVLGSAIARGLGEAGARVAVASRSLEKNLAEAEALRGLGIEARGYSADTTDAHAVRDLAGQILEDFGSVDVLVNAVGGNRPDATVMEPDGFFDLNPDALRQVMDLNFFGGAILPSQIFGREMAKAGRGSIINISSMSAIRPLTRVIGYSAAKAAVNSFTQWLAVHLAKNGYSGVRVNAIAPGFFLTEQNRFLLLDEQTGELTARGRTIVEHTPMGRFGEPDELIGAAVWLASDASRFVTGIVVPVDGGFSAFSGV